MRVLVVSDTHRDQINFRKVVERVEPDMVLHCGDVEGDEEYLRTVAKVPMHIVRGNMDRYNDDLPVYEIVRLGKHRVFLTHGDQYMVKYDLDVLRDAAREHNCDVALFGHTHQPLLSQEGGVVIANPGSVAFPRQDGRKKTFLVITDDSNGGLHFSHLEV